MFQVTQTIQLLDEQGKAVSATDAAPTSNVAGAPQSAEQLLGERTVTSPISNQQVAEILFNIATLLEMQQGNPYRIAAYQNAARGMMGLREPVAAILARGARLELPGLGDRLRRKIGELVATGRLTFYEDLCEESLPEDVRELMTVAHVGPRIALRLTNHLGVHNVVQLWEAARAHRLREHYGFGPRSEQRFEEAAHAALLAQQADAPAQLQQPSKVA